MKKAEIKVKFLTALFLQHGQLFFAGEQVQLKHFFTQTIQAI
jgi:hypothetical protein